MSALKDMEEIVRFKRRLEEVDTPEAEVLDILKVLDTDYNVDRQVLSKTKIGIIVGKLRQHSHSEISRRCKQLVAKWKDAAGLSHNNHAAKKEPKKKAEGSDHKMDIDKPKDTNANANANGSEGEGGKTQTTSAGKTEGTSDINALIDTPYSGSRVEDEKRNKAREIIFRAFLEGFPDDRLRQADFKKLMDISASVEDALSERYFQKNSDPRGYNVQLRSIKNNLQDKTNNDFNFKIINGDLSFAEVASMAAPDMASEEKKAERKKARQVALEACQSDWELRNVKRAEGQFPCGKCKSVNTSYFQMQTRSSDEPMTTFVTCHDCNKRWKF